VIHPRGRHDDRDKRLSRECVRYREHEQDDGERSRVQGREALVSHLSVVNCAQPSVDHDITSPTTSACPGPTETAAWCSKTRTRCVVEPDGAQLLELEAAIGASAVAQRRGRPARGAWRML
jgi:hypothetical protein